MRFKRMLKRKIYPTWVNIGRLRGCKAYVFYMPDQSYYHFQIMCDNDVYYISLADGIKHDSFKKCCNAAEKWIKENIIVY